MDGEMLMVMRIDKGFLRLFEIEILGMVFKLKVLIYNNCEKKII